MISGFTYDTMFSITLVSDIWGSSQTEGLKLLAVRIDIQNKY